MVAKKEQVHMDVYDERGIKTMDVHGLFDFEELSTEMVKALAHKQIPVIRRSSADETMEEDYAPNEEGCVAQEEYTLEAEAVTTLKWRFDGIEFSAEGPAEYVIRASAELLEYLEALT